MTSYAVGLSRDLPAARVMRSTVQGQSLAVWRSSSGVLSAWDNRCPHRGMALSHGFVRGEDLACLYHGWHFSCAGTCTLIPSHPNLTPPQTIQATRFAVQEQDGVIWVSLGDTAKAAVVTKDLQPLRSFEIDASIPKIQAGMKAVELPTTRIEMLFNPVRDQQTLVTTLADQQASTATLMDLSRWCETLRTEAEA